MFKVKCRGYVGVLSDLSATKDTGHFLSGEIYGAYDVSIRLEKSEKTEIKLFDVDSEEIEIMKE